MSCRATSEGDDNWEAVSSNQSSRPVECCAPGWRAADIPHTASKHAIVGMSLAARAELAHSGIRVSVLCPGTIMTPMIQEGASPKRWVGSYSQEKLDKFFQDVKGMLPDLFARKALHRIAKNDPVIVVPAGYKMLWYINRLSPSLAVKLSQQIYRAILKRVS